MIKFYIIFFITTVLTLNSIAQVQQEWFKKYSTQDNDNGNFILTDSASNIYVAGKSAGSALIIKYNSAGEQLWVQTYGNNIWMIDAFEMDKNGGLYLACHSYSAFLLKYNINGNFQWARPQYDYAVSQFHSLAIDKDSNIYVTGECTRYDNTFRDFLTIKYNSNGDSLWTRRYNGVASVNDVAYAVTVDDSLNVYVTGYSDTLNTYGGDILTIKYNSSGVIQWTSRYTRYSGDYNGHDYPNSICIDSKKNIIITGYSGNYGGYGFDYCTIKYKNDGTLLWSKIYTFTNNPYRASNSKVVKKDKNDNIFISGESSSDSSLRDYCTIKYDSSGNQKWVQRYDGPGHRDDFVNDMKLDTFGNVYITGSIYIDVYPQEFCTIKYNNNGEEQWLKRFTQNDSNTFGASSLSLDNNRNVYVTGSGVMNNQNFNFDIFTIKYSQNPSNIIATSELVKNYKLEQNYPNPFNPSTIIRFKISGNEKEKTGIVTLKIYNILGKEVAILVNKKLQPGTYEVKFEGGNLTSGVYFYTLKAGDFIGTKKMLLIK